MGFKTGPECPTCGSLQTRVRHSGYDDDGQRLNERSCENDCPTFVTIEVPIVDSAGNIRKFADFDTNYKLKHRLAARKKRGNSEERNWVADYQYRTVDRVTVSLRIAKGRPIKVIPSRYCRRGHLRTVESTILKSNGRKECRICSHMAKRRYEERQKIKKWLSKSSSLKQLPDQQ